MLASRLIRFQYRPSGVVHLATCHEDILDYRVISGTTLCDKVVHPGQGGWGHGPKLCPKCFNNGAPAERMWRFK